MYVPPLGSCELGGFNELITSRFGRHLKNQMLGFPAKILPMMGFSSCDNSNIFQCPKLVSIGGIHTEPSPCLHHLHLCPTQLRCNRDVCQPSLCPEAQAGDSPPAKPSTSSQCRWNSKQEWIHHGGSQGHTLVWPTHGESVPCSCQPQMADHHHQTFVGYPSQSRS